MVGFSPRVAASAALIRPRAARPNKANPTMVVIAFKASARMKLLVLDDTSPSAKLMPPETKISTIMGITARISQMPRSSWNFLNAHEGAAMTSTAPPPPCMPPGGGAKPPPPGGGPYPPPGGWPGGGPCGGIPGGGPCGGIPGGGPWGTPGGGPPGPPWPGGGGAPGGGGMLLMWAPPRRAHDTNREIPHRAGYLLPREVELRYAMGRPTADSPSGANSSTDPSASTAPSTRNSLRNPAIRRVPRLITPTTRRPSRASAA